MSRLTPWIAGVFFGMVGLGAARRVRQRRQPPARARHGATLGDRHSLGHRGDAGARGAIAPDGERPPLRGEPRGRLRARPLLHGVAQHIAAGGRRSHLVRAGAGRAGLRVRGRGLAPGRVALGGGAGADGGARAGERRAARRRSHGERGARAHAPALVAGRHAGGRLVRPPRLRGAVHPLGAACDAGRPRLRARPAPRLGRSTCRSTRSPRRTLARCKTGCWTRSGTSPASSAWR